MELLGARETSSMTPGGLQKSVSNYFLGNDRSQWRKDVPNYDRVTAQDIYTGIDLTFYGSSQQLEHDFQVAPGADPHQIRMRFHGARAMRLDTNGDLLFDVAGGIIRQRRPVAYQRASSGRSQITARYSIGPEGDVYFVLGEYDRRLPLVIDPAVVYGTYVGGSGSDDARGIAVDPSGAFYVTGSTQSAAGDYDLFVAKFAPSGTSLIYFAIIGGSASDTALGLALDATGAVYITGYTYSIDFPTVNAFSKFHNGGSSDAFVVKLAPAGNALAYSTFLGGAQEDFGNGIAVGSDGSAYVVGKTTSYASFPTQNAFRPSIIGFTDEGFVTRISPAGNTLIFSTYLGGNTGNDGATAVAIDSTGAAYVTGFTFSSDFPVLAAYDSHYVFSEAFVTKFSSTGSLIYSTYLGGSNSDAGQAIAVDASGAAYVAGVTNSIDFPTVNAFDASRKGSFVAKLSPSGSNLVFSTYFGGTGVDQVNAIAVTGSGAVYMAGDTTSTDLPLVNPYSNFNNGHNGFVARFSSSGAVLEDSTYLGTGINIIYAVTLDSGGNLWVAGSSMGSIPTPGGYRTSLSGPADGFVVKFGGSVVTVPITVTTNPPGLGLVVDGNGYTTPVVVNWAPGSPHTIGANSPQYLNGFSNSFSSWSNGQQQYQSVTAPSSPTTYTATFVSAACSYNVSTLNVEIGSNGGFVSVNVTAPGACPWTFSSTTSWLHFTMSTPNAGNGSFTYLADANLGALRTGSIQVAGYTVTVTQHASLVSGARFVPVNPCRIADSRLPNGPFGGPSMLAAEVRAFAIPGSGCGIPSTAMAYSLNVTVVPHGPLSFLTAWPTGQPQPFVSTLNSFDGRIKANAAIVPAGLNGSVSLYVTDPTDVVLDIDGYFVAASGNSNLAFYPLTPCRIADTRLPNGVSAGPSLNAQETRSFFASLPGCSFPFSAQAYSLNMTVVPPGALGFLTTWPYLQPQPFVSTLNALTGTVTANAAIVPAGYNGAISAYVTNRTDLVIDINGYFAPPGSVGELTYYPVTPCRIADTRGPAGPFGGPAMGAGQSRDFPITTSSCGLPSTAKAYSFNATVVPAAGVLAFLTLWGTGQAQPVVSTLNSFDGAVAANAAIVPAGAAGSVTAYVSHATDLIIDVNGYFAP